MEAVPRLPMICFDMKVSSDRTPVEFVKLKQYIREFYYEEPDSYTAEIRNLESLRDMAIRPAKDVTGCAVLKKYFCQLHFLSSRFPMGKDGKAAISFSWKDAYGSSVATAADIKSEMAAILYNIGALHSQLGAGDDRTTPDGLKMACTHFQCAAWAFQHLKDSYPHPPGLDLSPDLMQYKYHLCLAQAQECILEKSMTDNRKATINSKVAAQIVDYYNLALNALLQPPAADDCAILDIVGSKNFKNWKKYMKFKVAYYTCISLLYQGMQSEEQQKMGERVAYYQGALDKLNEAIKLSKGIEQSESVMETLVFTRDVVEGKRKAAKNENEFIYHEEVPDLDSLPNVKGASLVKGIPFNVNDQEISGPDIFRRLIPMKALEGDSLYSEEKAKLLRRISGAIDSKDEEVVSFMSCLQLEYLKSHTEPMTLPQEVVDRCAALSAMPDAIPSLMGAMDKLNDAYRSVDVMLKEINELIKIEEVAEKEYQEIMGSRPPSIVATDLTREANKYTEAHKKAAESNETLHKAMTQHIENLRVLQKPLSEIEAGLPNLSALNLQDDPTINEVIMLVNKVSEMRKQRALVASQLRESLCSDDITGKLITRADEKMEDIFAKEIQKHNMFVSVIEQNLAAQENILRALTDAYAKSAPSRKAVTEIMKQREMMLTALISSYDAYEDLLAKSSKGQEFYRKLETNLTKLLQRVKGTCKVQQEERDTILEQNSKKALKAVANIESTNKLKHYLQQKQLDANSSSVTSSYYSSTQTNSDSNPWLPSGIRPAPVGSEGTAPVCTGSSKQPDYTPQATSAYNTQSSPYYSYSNPSANQSTSYQNYHLEAAKQYTNPQAYYYQSLYANSPLKTLQYPSITDQGLAKQETPSSYDTYPQNPYSNTFSKTMAYNYDHSYSVPSPGPGPIPPASTPQPSASPAHPSTLGQTVQSQLSQPYTVNGTYPYASVPSASVQQNYDSTYSVSKPSTTNYSASYPSSYNYSSYYASPAPNTAQNNSWQGQEQTLQSQPVQPQNLQQLYQPSTVPQQQQPLPSQQSTIPQQPQNPAQMYQQSTLQQQQSSQQSAVLQQPQNPQPYQQSMLPQQSLSSQQSTVPQQAQNPQQMYQQSTLPQQPQQSTVPQQQQNPQQLYQQSNLSQQTQLSQQPTQISQQQYVPQQAESSSMQNQQFTAISQAQQLAQQQQMQQYYQTYGTNAAISQQSGYSQTYDYSNTYPNIQYQGTPGTDTSHYSKAGGNKPTPDTNSTMSPQGTPYATPYDIQNSTFPNYYTQPYGYQYYQGTVTTAQPLQVDQPTAKLNSVVYMQASNSKNNLTLTYSQQQQGSNKQTSNVDLLAGLDFTVNETPLKPQPSQQPDKIIEKNQDQIANLSSGGTLQPQPSPCKNEDNTKKLETVKPEVVERPSPSKTPSKDPFSDSEALAIFVQEVEKFEKFVEGLNSKTLNGPTALDLKWNELQDLQEKDAHKLSISVARCYPMKNRFADILPYDSSRVELPSTKDDYINASYIKDLGFECPHFIMTQSPLPSTYADFWSMVIEQHVELVICLLSESQMNNEIYWAQSKHEDLVLGKIKVSLQSSNVRNHWVERIISVTDGKVSRVVMHLEFTSWQSWIPESPGPLLTLVNEAFSVWSQQRGRGPVVVHCQSGVGRSGVFVFIAFCMAEMKMAPIHLPDTLSLIGKLAKFRKNPLRDRQHLLFSYQCLLYYAQDLLMKRGILASRSSFEEKRSKTKSHTRHPSEDFLLNSTKERRQSDASSTGSSSARPSEGDPLSQIDPLWPIKRYS